jgi:hypothetical protein
MSNVVRIFYIIAHQASDVNACLPDLRPARRMTIAHASQNAASALWPYVSQRWRTMEIDTEKVDEAVLALLYLTLHDGARAWKGFDWNALNRLHAKGLISNPVGKAKSVVLTDEGVRESERLFSKLFVKRAP